MAATRTKDSYEKTVYDFINEIYVVCPACTKQAIILCPESPAGKKNEHTIKLICTKCGHNKRLDEKPDMLLHASAYKIMTGKITVIGGAIDPYFHLPLWLTAKFGEHNLWAYNYAHLDFLSGHVQAKLRERGLQDIKNKSLGSRLPRWMTSAKNRESILKALVLLKQKK